MDDDYRRLEVPDLTADTVKDWLYTSDKGTQPIVPGRRGYAAVHGIIADWGIDRGTPCRAAATGRQFTRPWCDCIADIGSDCIAEERSWFASQLTVTALPSVHRS